MWEIAILVDKYDLREATKPWINLWVQPYLPYDGLPRTSSVYFNGDRGLFLAYAFGNEKLFKSVSKNIIFTWRCTPDIPQLHPVDSKMTNSFQFVPQPIVGMNIFPVIFSYTDLQNCREALQNPKEICRIHDQAH